MDEVRSKIKKGFLEVFQNVDEKAFDFHKDRTNYENWDSLTHMQLISEVESDFDISIDMDEIAEINKLEDLVKLVEKKLNAQLK